MSWYTYTVDGRPLTIELVAPGKWTARCNGGPEEKGWDLASTIRAALAPRPAGSHDTWEKWIRDQAASITEEVARGR